MARRYYEVDQQFAIIVDRDLATWLEYVLDHYVIKETPQFKYQIDRVQAVRFRRTLIEFLDAAGDD
jgi:hypothetical protein